MNQPPGFKRFRRLGGGERGTHLGTDSQNLLRRVLLQIVAGNGRRIERLVNRLERQPPLAEGVIAGKIG